MRKGTVKVESVNDKNLGGEKKKKMKTKTKMIAMVEIAIVLCSVFLVALPAIAAEQTTQKTITTASEDEFTLDIYGNANEDDTIDMRDTTYIKLAIFGKKSKTDLADANYDGKVSMLDVGQTKLIILDKERKLTIIDGNGEPITVPKPVERIIVLYKDAPEVLRTLNAADRIVGVSDYIKKWDTFWLPEISKLPSVGSFGASRIDYEAVLNLNPDVLLTFSAETAEIQEKLPGVTVLFLGLYKPDLINPEQSRYRDGVRKLGYILDKREEAEEFVNWRDGWLNTIRSRTEGLSEDEKPLVYNTRYIPTRPLSICCTGYKLYQMTVTAGGKDIAEGAYDCGSYTEVDTEWLIEQNPEIIIAQLYYEHTDHGYMTDDPSETAAGREYIMNLPVLANADAVKNEHVYMMAGNFRNGGDGCILGTAYMAKLLQPGLFEDLDPRAIHQEYLDRFQHFDFDVYEHGVFIYPPLK